VATILSGAMMLDWLAGRRGDPAPQKAAALIERAVARYLAKGQRLPTDLGGAAGTSEVVERVIAEMEAK
jgi:3-isopropylmalate dehydrogenase